MATTAKYKTKERNTASFETVMAYLHSVNLTTEIKQSVGRSLIDEAFREDAIVKLQEQYRLKKDLELFETYKDDWDGEGGKPLNPDVIPVSYTHLRSPRDKRQSRMPSSA